MAPLIQMFVGLAQAFMTSATIVENVTRCALAGASILFAIAMVIPLSLLLASESKDTGERDATRELVVSRAAPNRGRAPVPRPIRRTVITTVAASAFALGVGVGPDARAMERQHQMEWCWAASIQEVLANRGIFTTQEDIVARLTGSPMDRPAYVS